jgi:hypothetical protein
MASDPQSINKKTYSYTSYYLHNKTKAATRSNASVAKKAYLLLKQTRMVGRTNESPIKAEERSSKNTRFTLSVYTPS